jgi:hemerythrin
MFVWNESYSVGVAAMDNQHKRLVELVNRLFEAMKAGKGDVAAHEIMKELAGYTLTHFAAEEDLMRKAGYPDLTAHIDLHKQLMQKATDMLDDLKEGKRVATVALATFLKDWLTQHIQNEDRRYGLYIHNPTTGQK